MSKERNGDGDRERKGAATRRPYSPPAIRQEEVFETVAAGCAKFSPLPPPGGCGGGNKSTA